MAIKYCDSPYHYKRRKTRPVVVGDPSNGGVVVGDSNPIVSQSMLTCSTLDTDASVKQSMALVDVGCQIVRIVKQLFHAHISLNKRGDGNANAFCRLSA